MTSGTTSSTATSYQSMHFSSQAAFACKMCSKPTYCLCSQCKSAAYCSDKCQVSGAVCLSWPFCFIYLASLIFDTVLPCVCPENTYKYGWPLILTKTHPQHLFSNSVQLWSNFLSSSCILPCRVSLHISVGKCSAGGPAAARRPQSSVWRPSSPTLSLSQWDYLFQWKHSCSTIAGSIELIIPWKAIANVTTSHLFKWV